MILYQVRQNIIKFLKGKTGKELKSLDATQVNIYTNFACSILEA